MQDVIRISSFDGQSIWLDFKTELFEVGNFLGGGAAGNVYECEHVRTKERYAIKVLNPLGFKITASSLLRKFLVITKGEVFDDSDRAAIVGKQHIWWLMNTATKQYLACYYTEKGSLMRELSLSQCMAIWGTDIPGITADDYVDPSLRVGAALTSAPIYPPKYIDFLRKRDRIFREIRNMRKISSHPNVIKLEAVLELPQDSKCTIFLIMELANGGELFDRIKTDCGTCEDTAMYFFWQLLQGVQHCHAQGVCHRDLKPENLLLQGDGKDAILKIADFGFSAHFAEILPAIQSSSSWGAGSFPEESPLRVLKSVVGSPFYVAPEVLQASGYDGPKADVWSMGVILYAMMAGNLPFGHELATCKRFRQFCKWVREETARGVIFWDDASIEYPPWLFPARFSPAAKGLLVAMLHPDPERRITVTDAMRHPLCAGQREAQSKFYAAFMPPPTVGSVQSNQSPVNRASNQEYTATPPHAASAMDSRTNSSGTALEQMHSIDATSSMPIDDDDDDDEVFVMEEDDSPSANVTPKRAPSPPRSTMLASPPENNFRSIPDRAEAMSGHVLAGTPVGRSLVTPPTPLPIVPPSYLTDSGLIDLLDEDAKGEIAELDSPLVPHDHSQSTSLFASTGGIAMPSASVPRPPQTGFFPVHPPSAPASSANTSSSGSAGAGIMPAFNDRVKRSTRFWTVVPAAVILQQVETILQESVRSHADTPAGRLGRVCVDWNRYRLEVFDSEHPHGPAIFALQLYQIPVGTSMASMSLSSSFQSPSIPCSPPDRGSFIHAFSPTTSPGHHLSSHLAQPQEVFLVEFIRGQLEIFAFKRFYQHIRQRLSEYVKRDYVCKQFDPAAASPM